jgi:Protein of unknown function (DUF2515)
MNRRLQFPLDPKAVREANEALWRAHPELGRRQLTMDPKDSERKLRQEWVDAYLKAKGKQAEPAPPVPALEPVQWCPLPSCEELWRSIDEEVRPILNMSDPMDRNRQISAAYASMHQRKADYEWIGLAAIVSCQAGCAMQEAKEESEDWIGGEDAQAAYEGLAEANKQIFVDIYPVMRFAELHGGMRLRECSQAGGQSVPEQLLKAVERIEEGTPEGRQWGANLIADYEQRTVVQEKVYSNERYKEAFKDNEYWSDWWIGRQFGAKKPALPLSSECGKDEPIPLDGSILNADDRVKYYEKLMNEFRRKDQSWKRETMDKIKG